MEASREALATDELPAEFALTPEQALDAAVGSWTGSFDTSAGATSTATMDVSYEDGQVELVHDLWETVEETDSGFETERVASDLCPTRYEIPVSIALAEANGLLDETFGTVLFVTAAEGVHIATDLSLDDLVGTASPSWDSSEWEETELRLEMGWVEPATVVASMEWMSVRYPEENTVEQSREFFAGFQLGR